MPMWAHRRVLFSISLPYGSLFLLKSQMDIMVFLPSRSLLRTKFQWLSFSWAYISFIMSYMKSWLYVWMLASFKLKVSFTFYMLDTGVLLKLGRLYWEDLYLSSWWISLAEKSLFLEEWTWWHSWTHMRRRPWYQIYLVCQSSLLFPELFCFVLILRWLCLHTLGWGWRILKAHCYLLHLVKP